MPEHQDEQAAVEALVTWDQWRAVRAAIQSHKPRERGPATRLVRAIERDVLIALAHVGHAPLCENTTPDLFGCNCPAGRNR